MSADMQREAERRRWEEEEEAQLAREEAEQHRRQLHKAVSGVTVLIKLCVHIFTSISWLMGKMRCIVRGCDPLIVPAF